MYRTVLTTANLYILHFQSLPLLILAAILQGQRNSALHFSEYAFALSLPLLFKLTILVTATQFFSYQLLQVHIQAVPWEHTAHIFQLVHPHRCYFNFSKSILLFSPQRFFNQLQFTCRLSLCAG